MTPEKETEHGLMDEELKNKLKVECRTALKTLTTKYKTVDFLQVPSPLLVFIVEFLFVSITLG